MVVPADGYVCLTVTGLPARNADQVYQLWLLGRNQPISAGVFAVDPRGAGQFELRGLAWSPEYTGVAITIEPLGGSVAPTSDIIAQGDL